MDIKKRTNPELADPSGTLACPGRSQHLFSNTSRLIETT
jgi:hypothetical protein